MFLKLLKFVIYFKENETHLSSVTHVVGKLNSHPINLIYQRYDDKCFVWCQYV